MRLPFVALCSIALLAIAALAFWMGGGRGSEPRSDSAPAAIGVPTGSPDIGLGNAPTAAVAADVINELVRRRSEFSFTQATFALAASSSEAELEAYILAARGAADTRRGVVIANIMLSGYVEIDPEAAFFFARTVRTDMRAIALFRVFADWFAIDQDAAVDALDRLSDERERRAAEDGILQTASTGGPQRYGEMAARLGRTDDATRVALQVQAQNDPVAALNEARQLPQSERLEAVSSIGGRWAAQDPEAAYAYASSLQVDTVRDFLMRAIFSNWSRSDPERVVEILDGGVASNERDVIIDFGIAQMARSDAARAFDLVAGMQNAPMRAAALKPLLQVWASDDPYAAVAALDTLTTPDVRELATIVGPLFARVAPVPALEWAIRFDGGSRGNTWRYVMAEVARQDIGRALTLARETPPSQLHEALILVVGAGAQANPDAAARTLRDLPPEARDTGTQHVVTEWIKRDAVAAQRWVMAQAPGRDRDRGLEVLTGDPNTPRDQLATLVNAINEDSRRIAAARSVMVQRFGGDIAAARSFLNQLQLPRDAYEQLLRQLDGDRPIIN